MALPAIIGGAIGLARGLFKKRGGGVGAIAAPVAAGAVGAAAARMLGGKRRRRSRGGLNMQEMGKIMVMSHALGRNNPAVTLMMMKGLGGKL